MSIRELCRKHDISAHSSVVVQAQKGKWQGKREQYSTKESDAFIEKHAARMGDRLAEIHDKVIDVIDQALDKFGEDLGATKKVRQPDGNITEEPAWRMKPRDAAILIDRLESLFDHPARVTERHDLIARSELPIEALKQFVELTRERAAPPAHASPLPRTPQRLDD